MMGWLGPNTLWWPPEWQIHDQKGTVTQRQAILSGARSTMGGFPGRPGNVWALTNCRSLAWMNTNHQRLAFIKLPHQALGRFASRDQLVF